MMWEAYSRQYLRENKVISFSVLAAALAASLFISFITTLFYNMWIDSLRRAAAAGQDWRAGAEPTMLTWFFVVIMCMVCLSMALVLYHAFVMGANERMHQLGILQTVGATPAQIRSCLIQEILALSLLPVLAGIGAGTGLTALFIWMANSISHALGKVPARLVYHPLLFLLTVAVCFLTVGTAGIRAAAGLSRVSPLDAVRGGGELPVKRVRLFRLFSGIWGVEGEIARKALYARRKAFRASSLSLTLSFMVFSLFMNFWALTGASTKYTYFERYKDTWDLMLTVRGENRTDPELLDDIRSLPETGQCIRYGMEKGHTWLDKEMLSRELREAGGLEALKDTGIEIKDNKYRTEVFMVIMDRESFEYYLEEAKMAGSGVTQVTVNRIWDNVNSHFRDKKYLPFIEPLNDPVTVTADGKTGLEKGQLLLDMQSFTDRLPDLREEYPDFSLIHIMPEQVYEETAGHGIAEEVYFKIKAVSEGGITELESRVQDIMDGRFDYTLENRQSEEAYEMELRRGYELVMAGLCGLLALVGIANVFANTLGAVYIRKREFTRYLSVGFTPGGLARILAAEGCIVGLRPILASLAANIWFVVFAVRQSRLLYSDYLSVMPVKPVALFAGFILVMVGTAYWMAGRRILRINISEGMRDDTMF